MAFPRLVGAEPLPQGALAERSDDELMTLAQAGLTSAFATLVERHAARVVNLCSRLVGDAQLGRELAQDTWVLVWQGREKYRPGGGFVPWLVTVALNRCRNELRRNKVMARERQTLSDEASHSPGQLDELLTEERRRRVLRRSRGRRCGGARDFALARTGRAARNFRRPRRRRGELAFARCGTSTVRAGRATALPRVGRARSLGCGPYGRASQRGQ